MLPVQDTFHHNQTLFCSVIEVISPFQWNVKLTQNGSLQNLHRPSQKSSVKIFFFRSTATNNQIITKFNDNVTTSVTF